MTMVKTLVALATERMLLKTSGPTFLRGIEFMYAAGLAPDRLSVMMTSSHKFVLQFHSKCDIRPFAANYPNFARVLRGIVHVRAWRIKSIEFVNVAFHMRDVENLERAIEKLGVELVLLRNCTYPGVSRGEEAVKFLSALNRKKQAVVCEYGDDRLKHRIARRSGANRVRRPSRLLQEVALVRLNAGDNEQAAARDANVPAVAPAVGAVPVAVPVAQPIPQQPAPPPQQQQAQGGAAAAQPMRRHFAEVVIHPAPAGGGGGGPPPAHPHPVYRGQQNIRDVDPQVVALALQLLNDQQAQLHGILQAQNAGHAFAHLPGQAAGQPLLFAPAPNNRPVMIQQPQYAVAANDERVHFAPIPYEMYANGGGRPPVHPGAPPFVPHMAPAAAAAMGGRQRPPAAEAGRRNEQAGEVAANRRNAAFRNDGLPRRGEADFRRDDMHGQPQMPEGMELDDMDDMDEMQDMQGRQAQQMAQELMDDDEANSDEEEEDDGGRGVEELEAARAGDNENQGVGHDVLEQIMRDAAVLPQEFERSPSPQAALLH